jgi:hypothetical protein
MDYDAGTFDSTLAAAAGDDPVLQSELRAAFADSLARQVDLLGRSRCDGNWQVAALRLRGLAASFHAGELVELADEALSGAPGEPGVIRRLRARAEAFSAT